MGQSENECQGMQSFLHTLKAHPAEIEDEHHITSMSAGYSVEILAVSMKNFAFQNLLEGSGGVKRRSI